MADARWSQSRRTYPSVGAQFHGFWDYGNDDERNVALTEFSKAGGTWVRIDMGWAAIEEERDVYSDWALSRYDTAITQAHEKGLKVLLTIFNTPRWANNDSGERTPPDDPVEYGNFVADMADRYSTRVSAIELWNEPNSKDFFRARSGTDAASVYAHMARTAYEKTKQRQPSLTVLAGGSQYVDDGWWKRLYANGIRHFTDVVAVNPYQGMADESPTEPDDGSIYRLQHLPSLFAVMAAHGDSSKPVWFTEFGWSSHENYSSKPWEKGVSRNRQADYLGETLELLRKSYPQVRQVFWYSLRDRTDSSAHNNGFGLLTADLAPKPVLQRMSHVLNARAPKPGSR